MNEYDFVLKFKLPNLEEDPESYIQALENAGCDDALIGIGQKGYIALDFTREAETAEEAVFGAIMSVHSAIPGSSLLEASPDYVGLTDAASMLDFSRQYMRKLMQANISEFPSPVHFGSFAVYHFSEILNWLEHSSRRQVEHRLLEVANLNKRLNVCRQVVSLESSEKKSDEDCIGQAIPKEVREILKATPHIAH